MNYYERHIGDYLKDTSHLSLLEHGVYSRLLDVYYTREAPLPDAEVARLVGARSKDEREALRAVLSEFFVTDGHAWLQRRCETEIERFRDKQRKAKASADARWRNAAEHTERNANASPDAMRTHTERNADGMHRAPVPRHQTPDTKEKTKTARKRAAPAVLVCVDDLVAEGVELQHATDWLVARKAKGLPLTPTAWQQTKDEAKKARMTPAEAIKTAAGMQWAGFKASWLEDGGRGSGAGAGKPAVDAAAETLRALDAGKLTDAERVASREAKERVMAQLRPAIRVVS